MSQLETRGTGRWQGFWGRCAVAACEGGHSPSLSCHRWPDTSKPRVGLRVRVGVRLWAVPRQGMSPFWEGSRAGGRAQRQEDTATGDPGTLRWGPQPHTRAGGGCVSDCSQQNCPKSGQEKKKDHTTPVPRWSFSQREPRSSPEVPKSNLSPPRGWSPQQRLQGVMAGVGTPWGQGAWDIPGPGCRGEVRQALPPALSQHLRVGPARANTLEFLRKMKR